MLTIKSKSHRLHGEIWYAEFNDDKHDWLFMIMPLILYDDLRTGPIPSMQQDSNLGFTHTPLLFLQSAF